MAGYEQQKWQYNSLYPYQQMLGQAQDMGIWGAQQINSGLGFLIRLEAARNVHAGTSAQKLRVLWREILWCR